MLKNYLIIKLFLSFIIPYIILYAIYIQLNGEVSPGGGFQAGVIFASGIIGYELIQEKTVFLKNISVNMLYIIGVFGASIYGLTGALPMLLFNESFLNYNSLGSNNLAGQHLGIFLIEI
jgi:multicomponent Na+:H+ antiporter subunit B